MTRCLFLQRKCSGGRSDFRHTSEAASGKALNLQFFCPERNIFGVARLVPGKLGCHGLQFFCPEKRTFGCREARSGRTRRSRRQRLASRGTRGKRGPWTGAERSSCRRHSAGTRSRSGRVSVKRSVQNKILWIIRKLQATTFPIAKIKRLKATTFAPGSIYRDPSPGGSRHRRDAHTRRKCDAAATWTRGRKKRSRKCRHPASPGCCSGKHSSWFDWLSILGGLIKVDDLRWLHKNVFLFVTGGLPHPHNLDCIAHPSPSRNQSYDF
jgi:hypothetical protein